MSKATATCTCDTCGRKFEKVVYGGNRRDADSKAEWAERNFSECPDCYEARIQRERDEANAAAAKEAAEAGLPDLTGTEKQVAWANTLRQKELSHIREMVDPGADDPDEDAKCKADFERFLSWLTATQTRAAWWIDNRNMGPSAIDKLCKQWMETEPAVTELPPVTETPAETETRRAAEAEMVAAPENQTHAGTAEITVTETEVSVRYEKDDDFRAIVKRLGYRWDADRRVWCKSIGFTTGTAQERAAELGNNLLNAGFAVQIADPDTRNAAINGEYQPEHRRWVLAYTSGDYKGWLCIRLPERGDGMYEKAKAIKGSRYCKPNVAVPAKRWRELLDFSELNDYRISPAAQKIIDAQQAAVIVVAPAPVKAAEYHETDPADVLNSGADVLADLRDD